MADVAGQNSAPASGTTPKKGKGAGKAKKAKSAPSHPKVSLMVTSAITNLKERGGSSLQAIKKYIGSHYKVDVERLSPFIKKYLKSAVAGGTLIQTKGKGATGSFRISGGGTVVPKAAKKKSAATKKPKPAAAKAAKPKKAPKKRAAPKKSPSKPKAKKPKAKKPKSPKPKKAKPAPKKSAKKAKK